MLSLSRGGSLPCLGGASGPNVLVICMWTLSCCHAEGITLLQLTSTTTPRGTLTQALSKAHTAVNLILSLIGCNATRLLLPSPATPHPPGSWKEVPARAWDSGAQFSFPVQCKESGRAVKKGELGAGSVKKGTTDFLWAWVLLTPACSTVEAVDFISKGAQTPLNLLFQGLLHWGPERLSLVTRKTPCS